MPTLGGFISATGAMSAMIYITDYYTHINQPILQHESVKELLRRSEQLYWRQVRNTTIKYAFWQHITYIFYMVRRIYWLSNSSFAILKQIWEVASWITFHRTQADKGISLRHFRVMQHTGEGETLLYHSFQMNQS